MITCGIPALEPTLNPPETKGGLKGKTKARGELETLTQTRWERDGMWVC